MLADALTARARQALLQQQLTQRGQISVQEAAATLGVSEMTVRRDLQVLEELGEARRVWGGAVLMQGSPPAGSPGSPSHQVGVIARKLARLTPRTGAIAWDASPTMTVLASMLPPVEDLDIVTNSEATFAAMHWRKGVHGVLTGGSRDPRTAGLVGPLAVQGARRMATDIFFMSATAIDRRSGPSDASLEEASVKVAFGEMARRVVVAVDSMRLGCTSPAATLSWDRIDQLVTELPPKDPRLDPYRDLAEVL